MRKWRVWIGVAVSLICLVLAAAGVDWRQVGYAFGQATWAYLVPALVLMLAYLATRAVRWRILLGKRVPFVDVFAVTNIGYLVSNVLPFRLGDPARAVAIGLRGLVRTSAALSTIIVERVLDMAMVVLLLALTVPFVSEAGWTRSAGILGAILAGIALLVLCLAALRPDAIRRVCDWAMARLSSGRRDRLRTVVDGLLEGLAALRSWRRAVALAVWSAITWACTVGMYFFCIAAFVKRPTLIQAAFLTCTTGLGMAVPSSPGAVGVFHSVARYALELPFGLPRETALAIAFASHTFQYVVMCLLGLGGLVHQNLSLGRLQSNISASLVEEESVD